MAKKKKVAKKEPASGKQSGHKRKRCTLQDVCRRLDNLREWLDNDFFNDYKALRIAVVNLEQQAFFSTGDLTKRFDQSGGGTDDLSDPPKPPVW